MKTIKITYEAVFNIGNYQSLRLGGEYTLDPKENESEAYIAIDRQLRQDAKKIIADRIQEQEQEQEQAKRQAAQPEQPQVKKPETPKQPVCKVIVKDDEAERISLIGTALCKRLREDDKMTLEAIISNIDEHYEVSDKVKNTWIESLKLQDSI